MISRYVSIILILVALLRTNDCLLCKDNDRNAATKINTRNTDRDIFYDDSVFYLVKYRDVKNYCAIFKYDQEIYDMATSMNEVTNIQNTIKDRVNLCFEKENIEIFCLLVKHYCKFGKEHKIISADIHNNLDNTFTNQTNYVSQNYMSNIPRDPVLSGIIDIIKRNNEAFTNIEVKIVSNAEDHWIRVQDDELLAVHSKMADILFNAFVCTYLQEFVDFIRFLRIQKHEKIDFKNICDGIKDYIDKYKDEYISHLQSHIVYINNDLKLKDVDKHLLKKFAVQVYRNKDVTYLSVYYDEKFNIATNDIMQIILNHIQKFIEKREDKNSEIVVEAQKMSESMRGFISSSNMCSIYKIRNVDILRKYDETVCRLMYVRDSSMSLDEMIIGRLMLISKDIYNHKRRGLMLIDRY